MAMWQIVPLVALLAAVALSTPHKEREKRQVGAFYEDFIDPYQIDNTFNVDCGNATNRKMRVVFRGDARKIFSTGDESCELLETETGHYVIEDAHTDPSCIPTQSNGLELYTLDLTVQKHFVHFEADPRYLISCNYELGGSGVSGSQAVDNDWVEKTPVLVLANNVEANSTVELSLRDTKNNDVTSVRIGEFVQLVAFMHPEGDEESFRIWNCMASSNDTGVYVEHAILIEGCGDANVIRAGRGFRTSAMTDDNGATIRIARSVFFRAFALLNNPSVEFKCDYIIRTDNSADGPSCDKSRETLAGRKKRSADLARTRRQASNDLGLPVVQTDIIELLDPTDTDTKDNVVTYALNKNGKPSQPDLSSIFSKNMRAENRLPNLRQDNLRHDLRYENARQDNAPEMVSILTQPLVIGLMVTCAVLIMVPMMIACGILLTRTRSVRYVKPTYSSPSRIYMPDSPGTVVEPNVKLVG